MLEDFGEKVDLKRTQQPLPQSTKGQDIDLIEEKIPDIISPIQWTYIGKDKLISCTNTEEKLRPGYYNIGVLQDGRIFFQKTTVKTDNLIDFPDSLSGNILDEIDRFWELYDRFLKYGNLHRRGYLFYGPPGSGKSCLVYLICNKIIDKGDIVIECKNPRTLNKALTNLREVESDRRVVCIFEDIDSIVRDYGEDELLSILDGENQIDKCLNIATTNYPELLDRRLVGRPRRFDRVYKIDMPTRSQREIYFRHKLLEEDIKRIPFEIWIDQTEGFSFAAMAELIISVLCLDNEFDVVIEILRKLIFSEVSSKEYRRKTGF